MARKGVYLEVLVFAVCRTVSEFSFYRMVSFSAKNCTIKVVFRTIKLFFRTIKLTWFGPLSAATSGSTALCGASVPA
jgi:hypothetical protein